MIYKIADFNIEIKFLHPRTALFLAGYEAKDGAAADFSIEVTEADIDREIEGIISLEKKLRFSRIYLERLAILRKLAGEILARGAFLMHGAVIEYQQKGYIFGAASRTGKTTHILLWQELFGKENVSIINGDKPILRMIDGRFYAYGTPWCGKEGFNVNGRVELFGISFIKRAKQNSIEKISETAALQNIMSQIMVADSPNLLKQLELVGYLVESVPMYNLYCNKDIEAAEVAYNGMK